MSRKNKRKPQQASTKTYGRGLGKTNAQSMARRRRRGNISRDELERLIVAFMSKDYERVFNYKQVSQGIGIESASMRQQVYSALEVLATDYILTRVDRGRYKFNSRGVVVEGVFERRSNGRNFVTPSDGSSPIAISDSNARHSIHGDKVKVQLFAKRRNRSLEGEVIELLERNTYSFVGTVISVRDAIFVSTEDNKVGYDIYIPKSKLGKACPGDKVVAQISDWPADAKNPVGEIMVVLGPSGDNDTEMHAILAQFGLPYFYPERVEKAANRLSGIIPPEEIEKREDFREVQTFTIDPADAKDFDDAISFAQLENGKYQVGVHIADVSYFVTPQTLIDKEAYKRATSVYLVDRTIPMLPERLCNDLCSLKPECDRLAYSCIFEMNDEADVLDYRIVRTVIRSQRRFAYEEAQEIIEGKTGDCQDAILKLNDLASKLRKRRFKSGAIAFESPEVRFILDEKSRPVGVYIKESKEANHLIEELMLLANRTVAMHVKRMEQQGKRKTFVYRIHEQPSPEKLDNLSSFIARFGYRMKLQGTNADISKKFNDLLADIQGKPEESLISAIAIRSMAKARYSTDNVGHYGLAFDDYTHFTSPIRRYPDLMVHRMLTHYLSGGRSLDKAKYEEDCIHCSDMEQVAAQAERESIKYKQIEYMQDRLGKVFNGVISGVTEWGLYVELSESKCEGLVAIRNLGDDFYEYDEVNYCLRGRRSKKTYALGDSLNVRVASANLERRQLDFELV